MAGDQSQARERFPFENIESVHLPERLGGGWLFYGEEGGKTHLWFAPTWAGTLTPIGYFRAVIDLVSPGFQNIYLRLALSQRIIGLDPKTWRPSPKLVLPHAASFRSIAVVDEWFGAVSTEMRGLLVTFDAGASWHPLLPDHLEANVHLHKNTLLVNIKGQRLSLNAKGELSEHQEGQGDDLFKESNENASELIPAEMPSAELTPSPGPLGRDPLRNAVLRGWPLEDGLALLAQGGALAKVRLSDGAVVDIKRGAYGQALPCKAIALGDGVGFICSDPSTGTFIYRWQKPLTLNLEHRFNTTRQVLPNGRGALAITGPCKDSPALAEKYCIVSKAGKSHEIQVTGDIGAERVVALNDGRAVVLTPPRFGAEGTLSLIAANARNDESSRRTLRFKGKKNIKQKLSHTLWLNGTQQLSDTLLGTWVASPHSYFGVTIALDGKVRVHERKGSAIGGSIFAGSIAFEVDSEQRVSFTSDFGKNWQTVDAAPGLVPLVAADSAGTGGHSEIGCSKVGCAYGAWQQVGFDKPKSDSGLSLAPLTKEININPTAYADWALSCSPTGQSTSGASVQRRGPQRRARHGKSKGFTPLAALNLGAGGPTFTATSSSKKFRPFEGQAPPTTQTDALRLETGSNHRTSFRGYAWAPMNRQWQKHARWQVSVAGRFGLDGLWSTAITHAPWFSAHKAIEAFGGSAATELPATWDLTLDASERRGLLSIGSRANTQLHVLSADKPTQSFDRLHLGTLAGAVIWKGRWHFGQRDGNLMHLHRLDASGPIRIKSLVAGTSNRPSLIVGTEGHELAILIRTLYGSWYVYPLDAALNAGQPLHFSRELLNETPPPCRPEQTGYWAPSTVPPARSSGSDSKRFIHFEGEAREWSANHLFAKLLLAPDGVCLSELAAELAGAPDSPRLPKATQPVQRTFPLTVRDKQRGRRVSFRCHAQ